MSESGTLQSFPHNLFKGRFIAKIRHSGNGVADLKCGFNWDCCRQARFGPLQSESRHELR